MLAHYNTNLFLHAFPFIPFASHPTNPCSGQLSWQDRAFLGARVHCGASYASASEAAADGWGVGRLNLIERARVALYTGEHLCYTANTLTTYSHAGGTAMFGISGLLYIPHYISQPHHDFLIETVHAQPWRGDLARRTQHYGYVYDYRAKSVDPASRLGDLPP